MKLCMKTVPAMLTTKVWRGVQVRWWWRWMPASGEAWELMKFSSLKTLRALQTLAKLASELGSGISKHRYRSVFRQVQLRVPVLLPVCTSLLYVWLCFMVCLLLPLQPVHNLHDHKRLACTAPASVRVPSKCLHLQPQVVHRATHKSLMLSALNTL